MNINMATYASATNPFIKPNDETEDSNCNGQNERRKGQVKKNAPGMARPLSLLDELNKSKQQEQVAAMDSLLLDLPAETNQKRLASSSCPTTGLEDLALLDEDNNNNNNNNKEPPETNLESPERQSELQTRVALLERDIDEEIAQTCKSLVEQAAILDDRDANEWVRSDQTAAEPAQPHASLPEPSEQLVDDETNKQERQVKADNKQEDKEEEEQENKKTTLKEENEQEQVEEDEVTAAVESSDGERAGGTRRHQHIELIKKLRLQLKDLERYAHERGELERMPASVLLERQTVILDTLRKKLPHFSILADKNKIEKLELEELKRQADDEINNLIDPLITKEHLLNQLKTQLTDLEKYVSHLHGTIGITNGSGCPKVGITGGNQLNQTTNCLCALHGCSPAQSAGAPNSTTSPSSPVSSLSRSSSRSSTFAGAGAVDQTSGRQGSILSNDTLPKTSRLIRGLMAQLICSDMKIQEAMRMEKDFTTNKSHSNGQQTTVPDKLHQGQSTKNVITTRPPQAQFHDGAAWTLHIDRVILATDSLTNIYTLAQEGEPPAAAAATTTTISTIMKQAHDKRSRYSHVDNSLVDSVVRRQLVPALRDLLAYGLIDPSSLPPRSSYVSFFDPYYLLSSLTCLPGTGTRPASGAGPDLAAVPGSSLDKVHVWHVIADYFESRNEPTFRNSSVKTLSQSFNLTSTMDGPIKITSKQALLIAIDDIIERLARCKPDGPESHLKLFVYTALNQGKLATWIKIIFKNKAIIRKYYHNFSFVCQADKMERFLSIIDALGKFDFKLNTDTEAMDQFVSAF